MTMAKEGTRQPDLGHTSSPEVESALKQWHADREQGRSSSRGGSSAISRSGAPCAGIAGHRLDSGVRSGGQSRTLLDSGGPQQGEETSRFGI